MGPEHICSVCEKKAETFWAPQQKSFICAACQRLYNPPYMTLMKFSQGLNRLWTLEVGEYEEFEEIEEIENCGWFIRSEHETALARVTALVCHMEYFGEAACGRCVDYPYFESKNYCLPAICKNLAKTFRPAEEIQYPPERSRYTKWMKINR